MSLSIVAFTLSAHVSQVIDIFALCLPGPASGLPSCWSGITSPGFPTGRTLCHSITPSNLKPNLLAAATLGALSMFARHCTRLKPSSSKAYLRSREFACVLMCVRWETRGATQLHTSCRVQSQTWYCENTKTAPISRARFVASVLIKEIMPAIRCPSGCLSKIANVCHVGSRRAISTDVKK